MSRRVARYFCMTLNIALSGMDNATETALRAAFSGANAQMGGRFALVAESDAEHVIVDMDSMYGPMSWLRLHAAGKQIVGLTSASRVQTHFRLGRPFDDHAMAAMLREIAATQDVAPDAPAGALPTVASASVADMEDAKTASLQAPAPSLDAAPVVTSEPLDFNAPESSSPDLQDDGAQVPETTPAAPALPFTPTLKTPPEHAAEPEPEFESEPEHDRALPFATWIAAGVLRGRYRYRSDTGPTLWLDFDAQQYRGPSTLKPLTQYFGGAVARDALEQVDDATWNADALAASAPQPLSRLVWLGGLLAGDGTLAPGYDPGARYQLRKWPQTEREYPRHFRIATAMMKGPATLDEIVAASSLPAEEVIRFVNANLATGYAEPFVETPEPVEAPEKASGFFSRLRRR